MELTGNVVAIACLIFGFGFVVFFHELGHFLAAKWTGIKVEQFAVGFGHAIASWRQGLGWRWGSSGKELEARLQEHLQLQRNKEPQSTENASPTSEAMGIAAAELGLGETEYRLNWIPLGGYVKMLGQDDMNPNATSEDPRSYNRKSIGARMLVVSAGVIMNVILAAILFMVVFMIGFHVPPAIIGNIETNSPAQLAQPVTAGAPEGLRVGDRVLYLNGQYQHDFTKLILNLALVPADQNIPIRVAREGKLLDYSIHPQRSGNETGKFLEIGIGHSDIRDLRGLDPKVYKKLEDVDPGTQILPGDKVIAVDGVKLDREPLPAGASNTVRDDRVIQNFLVFYDKVQASGGHPVPLEVADQQGKLRTVLASVHFEPFFGATPLNIAGMQPRPIVVGVLPNSPASSIMKAGDVVTDLRINGDLRANPPTDLMIRDINEAGAKGYKVSLTVERDGKRMRLADVVPTFRTAPGKKGIGIAPSYDEDHPVLSSVMEGSAAERAKIPAGAKILQIDGQNVENWFDIRTLLRKSNGTATVTYAAMDAEGKPEGQPRQTTLQLSDQERQTLANIRYATGLLLPEHIEVRQTSNPLTAALWGVTETRDLLLQFYVTLQRLMQGSVGASNLMGPIGIVHAGSVFASKGTDWLIWFLAMISANLAVVNFLPIPIVDGGLFTFLIIEKLSGRPLSPRMQTVAQLVGLAIILSVFLLVTYQDIARIFL